MKLNYKLPIFLVATILATLLFGTNIYESKASSVVYIHADGAIEPSTANITTADNVTYTFTDNNYGSLVIERDNIIVDGAGHTLQGSGSGTGIYLSGRTNVTIKDTNIEAFSNGVWLEAFSNNNSIIRNQISGNWVGIGLDYNSSYNDVSGNEMTGNYEGVLISTYSNYNTISWNNISNNNYGIYLSSSHNNNIHHNNFMTNIEEQVYCYEASNYWDNNSEGNYWSDYTGSDSNSDGIGETPYNIDENNQDEFPLINIIPEFSSLLILPLLMLATSLASLLYKKMRSLTS